MKEHSTPAPCLQAPECFLDGASSYCFLTTTNSDCFLSWQVKWWSSGYSRGVEILGEVLEDGCLTGLHSELVCLCVSMCVHACLFPSAQYVGGLGKPFFMPLHCYCIGTAGTSKYTRAVTAIFREPRAVPVN